MVTLKVLLKVYLNKMEQPKQIEITPTEFESCCRVADEIEARILQKKTEDPSFPNVERWARAIISNTVFKLSSEEGIELEKSSLLHKAIEDVLIAKGVINKNFELQEKNIIVDKKIESRTKPFIISTSDALSDWEKRNDK